MTGFTELGLEPSLLEAIRDVGYEAPSPIQEQAIPPLLDGSDVIGQAQTGSGKTAAFGLPMLQYVDPTEPEVQGLVLTPTRELCIQVTQALRTYGRRKGAALLPACGCVVLDEADEMLDLGFLEDVEKIVALAPSSRQTALFSATMPPAIRKLADRYMYDPTIIQVEAATLTSHTVAQFQLPVSAKDKQ